MSLLTAFEDGWLEGFLGRPMDNPHPAGSEAAVEHARGHETGVVERRVRRQRASEPEGGWSWNRRKGGGGGCDCGRGG